MSTKVNYFAEYTEYEVLIVTTEQLNRPPCYSLHKEVNLVDLSVNYNRSKSYWSYTNLRKAVFHFFRQRKLLRDINPDFIISPNYNFDHFWLPFIKPKNSKLIKELHSSRFQELDSRKQRGVLNFIYLKFHDWIESKYDRMQVLNSDEAKYRPFNNVVVIPNPIELNKKSANLCSTKVIAAGRIAPVKGFEHLISAWQIIHQTYPDWELHIYGDSYGDTRERLQEQIDLMFLQNVVQIKSSVQDLPDTMLDYSIFVLSSETECFPTVLLESLSVGMPIVSYDCPNGPRHIIEDGKDGLLIKERNAKKLAEGIISLIEDEGLRLNMGGIAKKNSVKFEVSVIMAKWLKLLEEI